MAAITFDVLLDETKICPERLNEPTSVEHIRKIAIFLPSWRTVAAYLELSENDLDAVERDCKDEQDKRLKVLQKWKGKYGPRATYKKLVEVLLLLSMADTAEKICHLLEGIGHAHPNEMTLHCICGRLACCLCMYSMCMMCL